jgi:hypothetical protein
MENYWYGMLNAIKGATAVLVIAGGLIGIFALIFFSIFKLRKINTTMAIIVSTMLSCFLMVPVISSFNNLIDSRVEGAVIDEGKIEIRAQRVEVERLKAENQVRQLEREKLDNQIIMAKQSIEIEALNDNIKLLENSQLSMQSFEKILELALLQTNLKQTLVRKQSISGPTIGLGINADYYYDEVLIVLIHDINAKFGVDLNKVNIAKLDTNTVVVSGIRPQFIGTSKNITTIPIKEIRRNNYKRGEIASIAVQNNTQSINLADRYANTFETEFQTKLSEGLELDFMDDAVVQLAQNFIKVMFAPLYKNIRFTDNEQSSALSLMEYLQKELNDNHERKNELLAVNENLIMMNEQLETEAAKIEKEYSEL